jgi:cytochrome c5
VAQAEAVDSSKSGADVYKAACFACHETGVARAPRLGNRDDWSYRINYGMSTLYRSALEGRGGMPAMGGHAEFSDDEIRSAVDYMVGQVK